MITLAGGLTLSNPAATAPIVLGMGSQGTTVMDRTSETLDAELARAEDSGALGGLEIEFWRGGGLPPPNYQSDQLRLMTVDGKDVAERAVLRWDKSFTPPSLQDKWRIALTADQVRTVVRLIRDTHALATHFPEEEEPGVADIFSYEFLVTARGRQIKHRYYRKAPGALSPLQAAFQELAEQARQTGDFSTYHEGKRVR